MAPIHPQLHPAVTFNNKGFHNPARYERYLKYFRHRPLYPSFTIHPSSFQKYDLDVSGLIHNLGWDSLFENRRFSQCPEAVRMFYASLKRGPGPSPSFFTTVVYHHEILVTPSLLAEILGLPSQGSSAATNDDFAEIRFDYGSALESLTHDIGRHFPNRLSAGRLADLFKVMYFFITRILLPRSVSRNELAHPSDVWIMANARDRVHLNFSSLMFAHMIMYGDENYSGPLPFGPQITRLLYSLGIDLSDKILLCDIREDLRAQHILVRVDASVGRRKPVICSGGEKLAAIPKTQLVHALLDAASVALDQQIQSIKSKELCYLELCKAQVDLAKETEPSDLQEKEEDGVSDYESPPEYEF
ncbi:unnamed protein product [Linum tenue]|uniref:Uncharacterized protein n=1 Tax=Linum tenue TaxID=586396 RepID=A0AAV0L5V4_9ROSI|nr:unnamed protein product [Linum tenue]